jgi:hypothetical protein
MGEGEKICDLEGVREYVEGATVELWRHPKNGRLVVRAWNECGNNYTDVDLFDLAAASAHIRLMR